MNESYLRNVIEAALLAAGNPVPLAELQRLFEDAARPSNEQLRRALEQLAAEYEGRGIELKETASGFRVQVRRELAPEISRLWPERAARYSRALLERINVSAYGTKMPINQLATISVPEPRLLSVQVWDRSMVHAVEKAIAASNLGLTPSTEGQVLRLRIPELNEERRRELVKVAHKYAEAARVAVRHVRRDGLDVLKKLEKDHKISEDDGKRSAEQVQKATDEAIADIDRLLATKEKEVLTV